MPQEENHSLPDESNVRRFALAIGFTLLGFTLAGGHILPETHGIVLAVQFDRSWALLLFLVLTSVYAAYRYWYFAIKIPISRFAIRRYLKQTDSILVYKGPEVNYKQVIMQATNSQAHHHALMEEKCLPGLTPF